MAKRKTLMHNMHVRKLDLIYGVFFGWKMGMCNVGKTSQNFKREKKTKKTLTSWQVTLAIP